MNVFRELSSSEFESYALETFRRQIEEIEVFGDFVRFLGIRPENIKNTGDIPFLPVEFFKSHDIISRGKRPETIFRSSGTTGMSVSRHLVANLSVYEKSFLTGFKYFYGEPNDYCILALLPSYLEREGSSLVYMADSLIKHSGYPDSGFYLHNLKDLHRKLMQLKHQDKKIILIGVSYALLDLASEYPDDYGDIIVMETGGMKGKRKELTREELHSELCHKLNITEVHSEYGMTELLSQAYSQGNGIFYPPPWMKVIIKDTHDPLCCLETGKTGLINLIDLANHNSCSFIATSDLGKLHPDGGFEVLGRMDASDIRGCNLMVL